MNDKNANQPAENSEGPFIGSVEIRLHGTPARTTATTRLTGEPVEVAHWMLAEGLRMLREKNLNLDDAIQDARDASRC